MVCGGGEKALGKGGKGGGVAAEDIAEKRTGTGNYKDRSSRGLKKGGLSTK